MIMSIVRRYDHLTLEEELELAYKEIDFLKRELNALKAQPSVEEFKKELRQRSAETRGATRRKAFALT